jgi:hypothetical protein
MTIVQAVEHEVASNGTILPGRRDVFIVGPPGAPNPDLSSFSPPDVQVHSLVVTHILMPNLHDAVTYAASYSLPVLRYDAPPGLADVRVNFDAMLLEDIVAGLRHRLQGEVRFGGCKNRPGSPSTQ